MRVYLWLFTTYLGVAVALQPQTYHHSIVAGGPSPPILLPTAPPPANTLPPSTPAPTLPPTTAPTPPTATFPPFTPLPSTTQQQFILIDPRFGGGDTAESAISFPRDKRQAGCACYLAALCPTPVNTDGAGLIDLRIVTLSNATCAPGLRYCCLPTSSGQQSCGSRVGALAPYPTQGGQARYGDYPWMAVIMTTNNQYVGGGVLIDLQNVLTTAHRISSYTNGNGLKIRLGEWDGSGNYEQYPYRDFTISRVWTHEAYNPGTLQNDIALIRLVGGVPTGAPGVVPICLPSAGQSFEGQRCWVSGWGKNAFGVSGQYQSILKAVDVPVVPSSSCETTLRTTRLGSAYVLDRAAFLCAGGEANKDACTGDGGSGLVCETSAGRWALAGLVAWGIGCAAQGVPAAYVNVASYLPWIATRQAS